ncbi:hypothetical protein Daesc_008658 [Daldinia eschscholtzii]|uniref:Cyanovirin-N domain-containing protein n=1 Tax=Daldinia eschscholtzii TaxID=292717 RepID=A0AAX6MDR0_9PEZI
MRALSYLILLILSYVPALCLAAGIPDEDFNNELCPWYYMFQNYHNSPSDFTLELVATCGTTTDLKTEFITSSLNLDNKTCRNCGLRNVGSFDDSKPTMYCSCTDIDDKRARDQAYELGKGIWVNHNGTIGCIDHFADTIPYTDSKVPKIIPQNLLALMASPDRPVTVNSTVLTTVFSTIVQNNTLTNTAMVTNNVTLVNTETATATLVSTVSATCPSVAASTVTKTKKRKVKTVTATVTTSLVDTVVVTVTTTRPPTGTIVANIQSTAFASFSTIY